MSTMRAPTMNQLLRACALSSLLMNGVTAQSLRKGPVDRDLQYGVAPMDSISCRLQIVGAQFDDETEQEIYGCTLDDNETPLGGNMYNIDLSEDFVDTNRECMEKGACYIDIPGGQVLDEEGSVPTIEVPEGAEISPIDKSESDPTQRKLATGNNPVLIVRVTAQDNACNPTSEDLAGSILGIGSETITNNMKSQYERCSNGDLTFRQVYGNNVVDGVVEVYINVDVKGVNVFSLTNTMFQAASDAVGNTLDVGPRHIMYIVPPDITFNGASGWVAFAHVSGYNSWYRDVWGDFLSGQVHEIGHNLGLHHSNEDGKGYHDQSGFMGFSYGEKNGPLMCFNAHRHHSLGWYNTFYVDPASDGAWTGEIVSFVDANDATSDQKFIVNVGDVYMQLNSAKGFNVGTREKQNQVVLVEGTAGNKESDNLGGLASAGDIITVENNIKVELCWIDIQGSSGVDTAGISIYKNGQSSGCSTFWSGPPPTPPPPTPSPPTPAPTPSPTPAGSTGIDDIGVSGFVLLNTETNQLLDWGSKANKMSIRADTWGKVGSVRIILTGTRSHTKTENVPPYMVNGDGGWNNLSAFNLPSGPYNIKAIAYPESHRGGQPSKMTSFDFVIPK